MKKLFTLSLIFISCHKPPVIKDIKIDSMCFDGTSYNVWATVTRVQGTLKAIYLFGTDTLGFVTLMPRAGSHFFLLGTRESGCGGIVKVISGASSAEEKGNCKDCMK